MIPPHLNHRCEFSLGDLHMSLTLRDRLIEQLAPIGSLLDELVTAAYAGGGTRPTATAYPSLRRAAHLKRVSGIVCWVLVADGLVAAHEEGRFPEHFSVRSSDAQHNSGRYAFAFPGGVFSVRREPHDDDQDEGQFLQQSFEEVTKVLDEQGSPDATTAVRVWISIAPDGQTKLTARDRHDHEVVVTLHQSAVTGLPLPAAIPPLPHRDTRSFAQPSPSARSTAHGERRRAELPDASAGARACAASLRPGSPPAPRFPRRGSAGSSPGSSPPGTASATGLPAALELPAQFLTEPGVPAAAPLFRKRAIRSVQRLSRIQARLNTAVLIAQRLLDAGIELDPPQTFPEPGNSLPTSPSAQPEELRPAWRLPVGRVDDLTA